MINAVEELAKSMSGVAETAKKAAFTERMLSDCIIVLYAKEGGKHRTVLYDEADLLPFAKDVLDGIYKVVTERDELRAKVAELEQKKGLWHRIFKAK